MSASVDLLHTDIEEELRASVRALLADRCAPATVLARCEGDEPYDLGLWRMLAAELGCAGLAVPESAGGAGASLREAAVVAEELGAAVAPVPFLGSAGLATAALLSCGETDLLAELAAGRRTAAFAVPLSTPPGAPFPSSVRADQEDAGAVSGAVATVADALPADDLVVPGLDGDQPALFVVEASGAGRVPVVSLDLTRRLADLTFEGAPARRVAVGPDAERAFAAALRTGAALLANEQLGVAQRCLTMTVEYVKNRYQFARPVGSFQGLKHRLADLWVAITQARATARYAAVCVAADDPDADVAVAVAQAYCSEVALRAAEECVQMHGGIGFTWEHPAHLYLKRAKSSAIALGTADRHRATLATLVDLPGRVDGMMGGMPKLIEAPTVVPSAGNLPKRIAEYVGRASDGSTALSVAHMTSPAGWAEPGQRPDFDEFTLVLRGTLRVEHDGGVIEVHAGQAVHATPGEWVRYSTQDEGAEYVAICLPAFSPDTVHRDPDQAAS